MVGHIARWLRDEEATRLALLSYQAAKSRGICGAAPKCSNQADLHLTFIDPIRPSDLPQRPSSTSMPLATDQTAALAIYASDGRARIGPSDGPHERGAVDPALAHGVARGAIPPVP